MNLVGPSRVDKSTVVKQGSDNASVLPKDHTAHSEQITKAALRD